MGGCAVVAGGGRGIGAAIIDRLRIDGYRVMPLDLYESDGVTICDVTDPVAVEGAAASSGAAAHRDDYYEESGDHYYYGDHGYYGYFRFNGYC